MNAPSLRGNTLCLAVAAVLAASLAPKAAALWNKAELLWQDGRAQIQVCNVTPMMVMASTLTGFAHRTDNVIDFSIVKPA